MKAGGRQKRSDRGLEDGGLENGRREGRIGRGGESDRLKMMEKRKCAVSTRRDHEIVLHGNQVQDLRRESKPLVDGTGEQDVAEVR